MRIFIFVILGMTSTAALAGLVPVPESASAICRHWVTSGFFRTGTESERKEGWRDIKIFPHGEYHRAGKAIVKLGMNGEVTVWNESGKFSVNSKSCTNSRKETIESRESEVISTSLMEFDKNMYISPVPILYEKTNSPRRVQWEKERARLISELHACSTDKNAPAHIREAALKALNGNVGSGSIQQNANEIAE